jgi:hypothetical protein
MRHPTNKEGEARMEAATAPVGIRADYTDLGLGLRTRARHHAKAGCHTPGCRHSAVDGKIFCVACQATLDKVRSELVAAKPRGRKRAVGKAA